MEAVQLYQDAIRIRAAKLGAQHDDTVLSTNNLAVALQRLDRVDEAEELLQTSIDSMQVCACARDQLAAMPSMTPPQLNNSFTEYSLSIDI